MNTIDLPPNINSHDRVILFDGVCKLCNAWANFIIQNDTDHQFKLCSVQSPQGQQILAHFNLPTDRFDTMLYVEGGGFHKQSKAFFEVMKRLGYPWKLLLLFSFLPRGLTDWLYDQVALNRYQLFGQYDVCMLPSADHDQRFLDHQ